MSSSYVFDGTSRRAYKEDDLPHPLSVYGVSKLAAEYVVQIRSARAYVFRLTNMYGGIPVKGRTFIDRIVQTVRDGGIPDISDAEMSPSHVDDVAAAIIKLIKDAQPGLYNVASANPTTLYYFVMRALHILDLPEKVMLVRHEDPIRPRNSTLDVSRAQAAGAGIPSWDVSLASYVHTI